jgi:hypothetical protein
MVVCVCHGRHLRNLAELVVYFAHPWLDVMLLAVLLALGALG